MAIRRLAICKGEIWKLSSLGTTYNILRNGCILYFQGRDLDISHLKSLELYLGWVLPYIKFRSCQLHISIKRILTDWGHLPHLQHGPIMGKFHLSCSNGTSTCCKNSRNDPNVHRQFSCLMILPYFLYLHHVWQKQKHLAHPFGLQFVQITTLVSWRQMIRTLPNQCQRRYSSTPDVIIPLFKYHAFHWKIHKWNGS